MTKFEAGRTYYTRSICDHNCIFSMTVTSRTAKTIKAEVGGKAKTLRITTIFGMEEVSPLGRYSMSPIIKADDTAELFPDWAR